MFQVLVLNAFLYSLDRLVLYLEGFQPSLIVRDVLRNRDPTLQLFLSLELEIFVQVNKFKTLVVILRGEHVIVGFIFIVEVEIFVIFLFHLLLHDHVAMLSVDVQVLHDLVVEPSLGLSRAIRVGQQLF